MKPIYSALAQALEHAKPQYDPLRPYARIKYISEVTQWNADCWAIADALAFDDPNFNRVAFLIECDNP